MGDIYTERGLVYLCGLHVGSYMDFWHLRLICVLLWLFIPVAVPVLLSDSSMLCLSSPWLINNCFFFSHFGLLPVQLGIFLDVPLEGVNVFEVCTWK